MKSAYEYYNALMDCDEAGLTPKYTTGNNGGFQVKYYNENNSDRYIVFIIEPTSNRNAVEIFNNREQFKQEVGSQNNKGEMIADRFPLPIPKQLL